MASSKTYGVIPQQTHPKVAVRNVEAKYGLDARSAAREAVSMTRASKGTASAAVIAHGGSFPVMMCSLLYKTRKGKTPRRGFVHCVVVSPKFKSALKTKRAKRRR